jgi:hypothetical protein
MRDRGEGVDVAIESTVERLCRTSIANSIDPHAAIDWPDSLDKEQWFTSPELVTLYGTAAWDAMGDAQRKRLSFYEAINFYSLNIHGERMLIEGLSRRLYRRGNEAISPYLHHFLDEENKHMYYFGSFCSRYAGKVYPEKKLVMNGADSSSPSDGIDTPSRRAEEDFLFFAKVVVFEEIVDVQNREMAKDERLVPLSREINRLHHFEETRHLSFGRKLTQELWERSSPEWSPETIARIREYLGDYIVATWKEYYNPEAYRDAGLENSFALRRAAWDSEHRRKQRQRITTPCLRFLRSAGILDDKEIDL